MSKELEGKRKKRVRETRPKGFRRCARNSHYYVKLSDKRYTYHENGRVTVERIERRKA